MKTRILSKYTHTVNNRNRRNTLHTYTRRSEFGGIHVAEVPNAYALYNDFRITARHYNTNL